MMVKLREETDFNILTPHGMQPVKPYDMWNSAGLQSNVPVKTGEEKGGHIGKHWSYRKWITEELSKENKER